MICAGEIYDYLNDAAPFETAMGFDNVGLLVGSREQTSEKVFVALDATKEVLKEAAAAGAKIVVTHHPIIFHPIRSLMSDSIPYLAVQLGITVISAHTNLDIANGGVNDTLAKFIGIKEEMRFDDDCACLGSLDDFEDCRIFAKTICEKLSLSGIRFTDIGRDIRTVMVSCGAGGSNVFLAQKYGADAIVTGEIKHHEILFAKDNDIAVFDLGHYGSEKMIVPVLTEMLQSRFPDTVFCQSDYDTDGVIYIVNEKSEFPIIKVES